MLVLGEQLALGEGGRVKEAGFGRSGRLWKRRDLQFLDDRRYMGSLEGRS